MLGNNETIEGVDLKKICAKMVGELAFNELRECLRENPDVEKRYSIGGFRMDNERKYRSRMETFLIQHLEKGEFSQSQCNAVFSKWYQSTHQALYQELEEYLHSEEFIALRDEKQLPEGSCFLPQEKFQEYFKPADAMFWKILLCFSPMEFTEEQMQAILDDHVQDTDLSEKLKNLEAECQAKGKKLEQQLSQLESLRQQHQKDESEIQNLRSKNKELERNCAALQDRATSAVAQMNLANQNLAAAANKNTEAANQIRKEMEQLVQRAQKTAEEAQAETATWRKRHEVQCQENHKLEEMALAADKRCSQAEAERDKRCAEVEAERDRRCAQAMESRDAALAQAERSFHVIDTLLSRVNWKMVTSTMKPSPVMKRNFQSLLQNLTYDADRNLTLDATLPIFWRRFSELENKLIFALAKSEEKELEAASIQEYWDTLKDQFTAVQASLEARESLLGILQDIFYATYEDTDLEANAPLAKAEKASTENAKAGKKPAASKKTAAEKKPAVKKTAEKKTATAKKADEKKTAAEKKTATKKPAEKKPAAAKKPAAKKTAEKKTAASAKTAKKS